MNKLLCEGQIHGGVAQGAGQALMEAIVFDRDGQLVTGSFQDYAMPRAEDFPEIVSELTEVPATTNPLGVKGAGEAGATGAPPAIIGAILDALGRSASSISTCRRRRSGSGPRSMPRARLSRFILGPLLAPVVLALWQSSRGPGGSASAETASAPERRRRPGRCKASVDRQLGLFVRGPAGPTISGLPSSDTDGKVKRQLDRGRRSAAYQRVDDARS